ncbi:hypothetical protein M405DRAFT_161689 [Rhizopogon salebrosus TDB-379]|nr:hypothetical protein M405DRAFT_161689 [Rhizopogon salebrosus TDB-379]
MILTRISWLCFFLHISLILAAILYPSKGIATGSGCPILMAWEDRKRSGWRHCWQPGWERELG